SCPPTSICSSGWSRWWAMFTRRLERVGLAVGKVDELGTGGRGLGGLLEVVESRPEHREVVVVDWDGGARFGDLDGFDCLLARHRDDRDQKGRTTGVYEPEVDVGVAARNVLEAIGEHRVPGDVDPVEMIVVAVEVEDVAVNGHEQLVDRVIG